MKSQGLNLDFLERERVTCERSDTVILVKNLSYKVTEDILRETFSHYG
jgi:RNA recognition motif-containing protein